MITLDQLKQEILAHRHLMLVHVCDSRGKLLQEMRNVPHEEIPNIGDTLKVSLTPLNARPHTLVGKVVNKQHDWSVPSRIDLWISETRRY